MDRRQGNSALQHRGQTCGSGPDLPAVGAEPRPTGLALAEALAHEALEIAPSSLPDAGLFRRALAAVQAEVRQHLLRRGPEGSRCRVNFDIALRGKAQDFPGHDKSS